MIFIKSFSLWSFLWDPDLFIFESSFFSLRWYSVLFAIGFVIGRFIVVRSYKLENGYDLTVDLQMVYMVIGILMGSRIGHILFYEPSLLNKNFFELFFFWQSGLASHGAAVGIILSMGFYSYYIHKEGFFFRLKDRLRRGYDYYQVMDRMIIAVALGCSLIRIGNFINSEIIGKPTERNYGVIFTKPVENQIKNQLPFVKEITFTETGQFQKEGRPILKTSIIFKNELYMESRIRKSIQKSLGFILPVNTHVGSHVINPLGSKVEHSFVRTPNSFELHLETVGIYRHPSQIYEAITYGFIWLLIYFIYNKHRKKLRPGSLFGLFLITIFPARFLLEFFKENQVAFENNLYLNMGQFLSIPLFLYGIYVFFRNLTHNRLF